MKRRTTSVLLSEMTAQLLLIRLCTLNSTLMTDDLGIDPLMSGVICVQLGALKKLVLKFGLLR